MNDWDGSCTAITSNMLRRGKTLEDVAECLGFPLETVECYYNRMLERAKAWNIVGDKSWET